MNKIYERGRFYILDGGNHFILVNKTKHFKDGHTHLTNYNTAVWLIKLSEHHSIPHRISPYLLESLIRVNSDEMYLKQLRALQSEKRSAKNEKRNPKRTG